MVAAAYLGGPYAVRRIIRDRTNWTERAEETAKADANKIIDLARKTAKVDFDTELALHRKLLQEAADKLEVDRLAAIAKELTEKLEVDRLAAIAKEATEKAEIKRLADIAEAATAKAAEAAACPFSTKF